MRVVDHHEMRALMAELEQKYFLSEDILIEHYALQITHYLKRHYCEKYSFKEIVIIAGKGKKGAVGCTLARQLWESGLSVRVFLLFPEAHSCPAMKKSLAVANSFGVNITDVKSVDFLISYFQEIQGPILVVDALVGTGLRLPLSVALSDTIHVINDAHHLTVSLDIPSGVLSDSGGIDGVAIKSHETFVHVAPKYGHFLSAGAIFKGQLTVLSSPLPSHWSKGGMTQLLPSSPILQSFFRERQPYGYKRTFGHLLIVGGREGLMGANILASLAALHSGVGLLSTCTWEQAYGELVAQASPEMVLGKIPESEEAFASILKTFDRYQAVVVGPGLGVTEKTHRVVEEILSWFQGPVVLDADALNVLRSERDQSLLYRRKAPTILTPHVGEFAQFLGVSKADILEKPFYWIRKVAEETNCILLVKGPCTLMGFPDGHVYVYDRPNDGMAMGGVGTVLTGILGSVLAQLWAKSEFSQEGKWRRGPMKREMSSQEDIIYETICFAIHLHAHAGQLAVNKRGGRGVTVTDIIHALPLSWKQIEHQIENQIENERQLWDRHMISKSMTSHEIQQS